MNIKINDDLTPESAGEFLLLWVEDKHENKIITKEGLFFGNPKNKLDGYIGIYKKKNALAVDSSLNPDNALGRGYRWVSDSIYDPEAPDEINQDFVNLTNDGYLLGEPANVNTIQNGGVGIYKPI